jgi:hypothetical protein
MGSRQIVLVSTAGFSVLNTGIFWREAKTKRLFSQCGSRSNSGYSGGHSETGSHGGNSGYGGSHIDSGYGGGQSNSGSHSRFWAAAYCFVLSSTF